MTIRTFKIDNVTLTSKSSKNTIIFLLELILIKKLPDPKEILYLIDFRYVYIVLGALILCLVVVVAVIMSLRMRKQR